MTDRTLSALTLVAQGGVIVNEAGHALVPSAKTEGAYYRTSSASCSCPDHKYRGVVCKHMLAVRVMRTIALAEQETITALAAPQAA
jgi:hypothetical protein